jgi:tetratricopeptide (TPR) repeat protein
MLAYSPFRVLICLLILLPGAFAFTQPSPWQQGIEAGYQALREKRYEDAEWWFQHALVEIEALPPGEERLVQALNALGVLYRAWSPARGETFFRDLGARWEKENPDDPRIASLLCALAALQHREPIDAGGYARVVPLYWHALRILEGTYGETAPRLMEPLERLAYYAAQTGREEAQQHYSRAIDIKLAADERDSALASLYDALGGVHWDADRHTAAAEAWTRALDIYYAVDPGSRQTASTLNRLAWAEERLGDYPRMAELWERAATIREVLDPNGWELLQTLGNLADAQFRLGRLTDAEQTCRRDLEIRRRAQPGTGDPVQIMLADIYLLQGRINEATAIYRGIADPFGMRVHAAPARFRIRACLGLGRCALAGGDRETAMPWLIRARELLDNTLGADDDETSITLLLALHEYADAAHLCASLLEADARYYSAEHPRVADHLALLAQARARAGAHEPAKEHIAQALAVWDRTLGSDPPALIDRLLTAAEIFRVCEMNNEDAACLSRAEQIADESGSIDGLLALARHYHRAGDAEQVRRCCEHALRQTKRLYAANDPRILSVQRQCDVLQSGENSLVTTHHSLNTTY